MTRHRTRTAVAASALAVLGLGLGPTVAAAAGTAGATIVLPDDVVQTADPFRVTGTCVEGSRSAVVTVTQDGRTVTSAAADLSGDLHWTATLDISSADDGEARAMVACFDYPDRDALSTAAATFYAAKGRAPYSVDVTVTPSRVALGGTITVSGTCEPGTTDASVLVGDADAQDPFAEQLTSPAADGSISVEVTIAGESQDGRGPRVGDAIALVFCGDRDAEEQAEFGLGLAEFTITQAPTTPATSPVVPGAAAGGANDPDAAGGLANTGVRTAPLTAMAGVLLLGGLGLHRMRRRISAH